LLDYVINRANRGRTIGGGDTMIKEVVLGENKGVIGPEKEVQANIY